MKSLGRFVRAYVLLVVFVFGWEAMCAFVAHKLGLIAIYNLFSVALVFFPLYGFVVCLVALFGYKAIRSGGTGKAGLSRQVREPNASAATAINDGEINVFPWQLDGECDVDYLVRGPSTFEDEVL